ncbi:MAG TPA: DNA alkylation repair protein [Thermoanaerobaculia bacterium]|nr:DNA alkylation repair protein [Thermoanaerobaculia bacterium]
MAALTSIRKQLRAQANPEIAAGSLRFFKTAPGQYGHGDKFLGLRVPALRAMVRDCDALSLGELETLLDSEWHEERLLALLSMSRRYTKREEERDALYALYLSKTDRINNWDLVDSSAEHVVGAHLRDRSRAPLTRLAKSKVLWERRIAILATFHYIKRGEYGETLRIAKILLHDPHDLMHKAVGWMLREVGKRDHAAEEAFLREHAHEMPRTMLRYAIERFPEELRREFMNVRRA